MTHPDDAAKAAKLGKGDSNKPESGRKHLDPSRYQVSTLPAQVRSEYQRLPIHRFSEEELKPPPGYGGTPAVAASSEPLSEIPKPPTVGVFSGLVAKLKRHKLPLIIGCLVGLCVVVLMWMRGGSETAEPTEGASSIPVRKEATPMAQPERTLPTNADNVQKPAAPSAVASTGSTGPSVAKVPPTKSEALPRVDPSQQKSQPNATHESKKPQGQVVHDLLIDR